MSETQRPKVFNALTGYRAVAAFMVVFFHSGFSSESLGKIGFGIQNNLNIGVSLFFVLSGFLIVYRNYNKIQFNFTWMRKYFQNRLARLYPVYLLYSIAVFWFMGRSDLWELLLNSLMLSSLLEPSHQFVMVAWSLTVEENFYLATPFILYLFKRNKYFQPLVISVLIAIGLMGVIAFFPMNIPYFNFNNTYTIFKGTFFGRAVEFFVGAYLALAISKGKLEVTKVKSYRFTLLGVFGIFLVLALLVYVDLNSWMMLSTKNMKFLKLGIRAFLLPFPVVFFIWGLIKEETIVSRVLGSKVFIILGNSSYILYLIHLGPVGGIVYNKLKLGVLGGFVALNIISILIYFSFEKPLQKRLRAKP